MIKYFINFVFYAFLLTSLNSCSTISETIDLAGIVDKTEDLFFGKKKDLENMEVKTDEDLIEENISEEEIPDISDIPTDKPEFSDLEKDFFEGEKDEIVEEKSEVTEYIDKKENLNEPIEISLEEKNLKIISNIPNSVRMRVRQLMYNSDPPTKNDGKRISYESEKTTTKDYKEEDKIAVFYFPNNSITPDAKAKNVIGEIVKIYQNSSLILVGHSSSLGGDSPNGKKINMELSFARAEAIKSMLIDEGFPAEYLSVLGQGDLQPEIEQDGSIVDSKNRRVEVFLLPN